MNLINIPPPPPPDQAQLIAEDILGSINYELSRRVEHHKEGFNKFWNSSVTPDEILEKIGTNAKLMLEASRANLRNINELAQMINKTLLDFIPQDNWYPKRAFIENEDGTATLEPPEDGFDLWGRPTNI